MPVESSDSSVNLRNPDVAVFYKSWPCGLDISLLWSSENQESRGNQDHLSQRGHL